MKMYLLHFYLNTSHVKVKPQKELNNIDINKYLNTSHVKVKQ